MEVSCQRWVAEQLAEGRAPLCAFQVGSSGAHPSQHGLPWDPRGSREVVVCTEGGSFPSHVWP